MIADRHPPQDFWALKTRIEAEHAHFPRRLKQIASTVLTAPDEIAFSTIAQISRSAGVQPSSLVRFAQNLGYRGFSEMQAVFRERLKQDRFEHRARVDDLPPHGARLHFEAFADAAHRSLNDASQRLNGQQLDDVIAGLAQAERIFVVANRRAFPAGAYAAYAFGALGLKAILIDQIGGLGRFQLDVSGPSDALLAISFSPYAEETLDLARRAFERQVPVFSLTDGPTSPLLSFSKAWIEINEADYAAFRSLAATLTLIMTLAASLAKNKEAVLSKAQ